MPSVKTTYTLHTGASRQEVPNNTSEYTNTLDLTGGYGGVLYIKVANSSDGYVETQASDDGANWYKFADWFGRKYSQSGEDPFTELYFVAEIPVSIKYIRMYIVGNTSSNAIQVTTYGTVVTWGG